MKPLQLVNRKCNYVILSFAFPFLAFLIFMMIQQCCPFGNNSLLLSDMYHQYYPFFKNFRTALLSGDSLLYNWSIGMGLDYLGLYSYYLASPLNLLSVLIPENWLLGYFSLLVPIKLGFAGMFFGIFLQKIFHKKDISIPLFSSFYGLCAWALGYQWNIMWLDTFALLPLVVLGTISLLRDKKFILYTISLFLSVSINYYIGLFTCIFVFLVFVCYEICRFKGILSFFKDLGRIAAFTILGIGMTALISLPTLAALQNTQSSVNTFPEGFRLNIAKEHNLQGLFKAMMQVAGNMNAGITPTFKEGLPNVYCGAFAIVFAVLYLLCNQIRVRDKICAVGLLLFFSVSFIIRQLDYVWHGFHFPNMIPFRFSFLYSFVMLYMAYSAWINRRHFKLWQLLVAAAASLGIMFCFEDKTDLTFLVFNTVLLLLYYLLLIYYSSNLPVPTNCKDAKQFMKDRVIKRCLCSLLLLAVIAAEIVINMTNFCLEYAGTNISYYPRKAPYTGQVIDYMKEREKDNLFYRAEVAHTQSLNDSALNGYNGITTFTSSANVNVTKFMRALGYGAKDTYNRYSFEESSPVANLFLGLKYMIERYGEVEANPYFDDIHSVDSVHLLENNAYLPLGFLANSQLVNVKFTSDGYRFSFQNQLMRNAAGVQGDVWHTLPGKALTISGDCPTLTPQPNTGYCEYTTESEKCTITYTYTADREGLMCVNLDLSKRNDITFIHNGNMLYEEGHSLPQMHSICQVVPGDIVEIQFACDTNETGTLKVLAAILDETLFRQGYETLAASVLELTSFSNTNVEGTINCNRDGVLYTSIPQNGNWKAFVDGEPADITLIGDAMIGLLLSEGQHTVRFVYKNDAFALGWKVSLACLLVFIGIYLTVYKPSFRRIPGKYEQKK